VAGVDDQAVPGRKTDVTDAEWLADLLRHGLIAPSFVSNQQQRGLRESTRHRGNVIGRRTSASMNCSGRWKRPRSN